MHNQDTAKDDVMEAIFELLKKTQEYLNKKINSFSKDENLIEGEKEEVNHNSNVNKIERFQSAMKNILESDASDNVKKLAQTFHDHPKDSMKMLQSIISEQAIQQTKELTEMTSETSKMLKSIKEDIDMSKPNAMDQLAIINRLEKEENKKEKLANSILNELKPLEKEYEKETLIKEEIDFEEREM
ncbi:hypothetical protein MKX83_23985 [Cytobacillus sp. FSL M8-0252]|uniref:hypothetical protein n=1 Tax=Cytobacillus sp. FSL M8-0252 TaxID=2921621 RepID=UPI0030FCC09F